MRRRLTFAFSSSQFLFLVFSFFLSFIGHSTSSTTSVQWETFRESPEDQELFLKGSTALVVSTKMLSKEFSGQLWTFLRIPLSCLTESCTFGYGSKDLSFLYSTCLIAVKTGYEP